MKELKCYAKEYEKDMPTEMKLIYDAKSGKFKAEYEYDLIHTNDDIKNGWWFCWWVVWGSEKIITFKKEDSNSYILVK